MNPSSYETMHFINLSAVDDLVIALKRSENILNIDHTIRSNLVLESLSNGSGLTEIVQEFTKHIEKYIIIKILEFTNGNKSMAARILKINYKTLHYKIKIYCIKILT